MLFRLFKLFGLDVAAEVEAAKAKLEQRLERASDHIKGVAEGTAVIAMLGIFASITATMALAVGLIALYRGVSRAYGDCAGLGADAALLIMMTAALAAVIFAKARALSLVTSVTGVTGGSLASAVPGSFASSVVNHTDEMPIADTPDHLVVPVRLPPAPRDHIDPLTLVLSEVIPVPNLGNPVVDELIGKIRTTARSNVDDAVYRAASVIRYGRPTDLMLVLTGTAALAWLITRNAHPSR
jgi:hypothetical protein